jgi:hypothetical protein
MGSVDSHSLLDLRCCRGDLFTFWLFRLGKRRAMGHDDVVMESILDIRNGVLPAIESLEIGLILGKQHLRGDTLIDNDGLSGRSRALFDGLDRAGRLVQVAVHPT